MFALKKIKQIDLILIVIWPRVPLCRAGTCPNSSTIPPAPARRRRSLLANKFSFVLRFFGKFEYRVDAATFSLFRFICHC
jgi:hypothetical protein